MKALKLLFGSKPVIAGVSDLTQEELGNLCKNASAMLKAIKNVNKTEIKHNKEEKEAEQAKEQQDNGIVEAVQEYVTEYDSKRSLASEFSAQMNIVDNIRATKIKGIEFQSYLTETNIEELKKKQSVSKACINKLSVCLSFVREFSKRQKAFTDKEAKLIAIIKDLQKWLTEEGRNLYFFRIRLKAQQVSDSIAEFEELEKEVNAAESDIVSAEKAKQENDLGTVSDFLNKTADTYDGFSEQYGSILKTIQRIFNGKMLDNKSFREHVNQYDVDREYEGLPLYAKQPEKANVSIIKKAKFYDEKKYASINETIRKLVSRWTELLDWQKEALHDSKYFNTIKGRAQQVSDLIAELEELEKKVNAAENDIVSADKAKQENDLKAVTEFLDKTANTYDGFSKQHGSFLGAIKLVFDTEMSGRSIDDKMHNKSFREHVKQYDVDREYEGLPLHMRNPELYAGVSMIKKAKFYDEKKYASINETIRKLVSRRTELSDWQKEAQENHEKQKSETRKKEEHGLIVASFKEVFDKMTKIPGKPEVLAELKQKIQAATSAGLSPQNNTTVRFAHNAQEALTRAVDFDDALVAIYKELNNLPIQSSIDDKDIEKVQLKLARDGQLRTVDASYQTALSALAQDEQIDERLTKDVKNHGDILYYRIGQVERLIEWVRSIRLFLAETKKKIKDIEKSKGLLSHDDFKTIEDKIKTDFHTKFPVTGELSMILNSNVMSTHAATLQKATLAFGLSGSFLQTVSAEIRDQKQKYFEARRAEMEADADFVKRKHVALLDWPNVGDLTDVETKMVPIVNEVAGRLTKLQKLTSYLEEAKIVTTQTDLSVYEADISWFQKFIGSFSDLNALVGHVESTFQSRSPPQEYDELLAKARALFKDAPVRDPKHDFKLESIIHAVEKAKGLSDRIRVLEDQLPFLTFQEASNEWRQLSTDFNMVAESIGNESVAIERAMKNARPELQARMSSAITAIQKKENETKQADADYTRLLVSTKEAYRECHDYVQMQEDVLDKFANEKLTLKESVRFVTFAKQLAVERTKVSQKFENFQSQYLQLRPGDQTHPDFKKLKSDIDEYVKRNVDIENKMITTTLDDIESEIELVQTKGNSQIAILKDYKFENPIWPVMGIPGFMDEKNPRLTNTEHPFYNLRTMFTDTTRVKKIEKGLDVARNLYLNMREATFEVINQWFKDYDALKRKRTPTIRSALESLINLQDKSRKMGIDTTADVKTDQEIQTFQKSIIITLKTLQKSIDALQWYQSKLQSLDSQVVNVDQTVKEYIQSDKVTSENYEGAMNRYRKLVESKERSFSSMRQTLETALVFKSKEYQQMLANFKQTALRLNLMKETLDTSTTIQATMTSSDDFDPSQIESVILDIIGRNPFTLKDTKAMESLRLLLNQEKLVIESIRSTLDIIQGSKHDDKRTYQLWEEYVHQLTSQQSQSKVVQTLKQKLESILPVLKQRDEMLKKSLEKVQSAIDLYYTALQQTPTTFLKNTGNIHDPLSSVEYIFVQKSRQDADPYIFKLLDGHSQTPYLDMLDTAIQRWNNIIEHSTNIKAAVEDALNISSDTSRQETKSKLISRRETIRTLVSDIAKTNKISVEEVWKMYEVLQQSQNRLNEAIEKIDAEAEAEANDTKGPSNVQSIPQVWQENDQVALDKLTASLNITDIGPQFLSSGPFLGAPGFDDIDVGFRAPKRRLPFIKPRRRR